MLKRTYKLIMDDNTNAFNSLPKTVRFQLMTILAYMWCAIFSAGIGSYFIFGTSVIFHTLFLAGLFVTASLFDRARNNVISQEL